MRLLESDEKRWIKKYLEGQDVNFSNDGMRFGSRLSAALENEEESEDMELAAIKSKLFRYDIVEHELSCSMKSSHGEIPLFGKMDTGMRDLSAFREVKTGRVGSWNQKKAEAHGQLYFYSAMIYILTGKIPKVHLDWVITDILTGATEFTGEIKSFEVKITVVDIIRMKSRILKNAIRIDELVRASMADL